MNAHQLRDIATSVCFLLMGFVFGELISLHAYVHAVLLILGTLAALVAGRSYEIVFWLRRARTPGRRRT